MYLHDVLILLYLQFKKISTDISLVLYFSYLIRMSQTDFNFKQKLDDLYHRLTYHFFKQDDFNN